MDYEEALTDKTILVTGGSGTLGTTIVRRLLRMKPKAVRIFSRNEYLQWSLRTDLQQETMGFFNLDRARFMIGDIRDKDRLYRAMNGCDYVIHAAAMKHIDICAYNPIETVKTNILGSINVVDCALDNGVKNVLAVSTDKAVHPIGVYGASKLAMERLFVDSNVYGDTKFACIRFGNIEGSEGSVLEKWKKQHEAGEELTITDKDMTRFFITQVTSAEYILRFLTDMKGGEIFVPKCESKSIHDMAVKMYPNDKIRFTGIRPGEKLHEMLISEGEIANDCGLYWTVK